MHCCWGGCRGKNRGGAFATPRRHAAGGSVCAPHLALHSPRPVFLSYPVKEARGWFVPGHPSEWRHGLQPGPHGFLLLHKAGWGSGGWPGSLQAHPCCPACPPPLSESQRAGRCRESPGPAVLQQAVCWSPWPRPGNHGNPDLCPGTPQGPAWRRVTAEPGMPSKCHTLINLAARRALKSLPPSLRFLCPGHNCQAHLSTSVINCFGEGGSAA